MIIITRANISDAELDAIRERIEQRGMRTHLSRGVERTIIGCIGDESLLAEVPLRSMPGVEDVVPVLKPYKLASREFAAAPTVVRVGDDPSRPGRVAAFGGSAIAVIAGPCSVEGPDMLRQSAEAVRDAGGVMLRGGAFKPRTSPYAFQGLGATALKMLADVRRTTGMPVVTEVMDPRQIDDVA